jgi:hypothetical protein
MKKCILILRAEENIAKNSVFGIKEVFYADCLEVSNVEIFFYTLEKEEKRIGCIFLCNTKRSPDIQKILQRDYPHIPVLFPLLHGVDNVADALDGKINDTVHLLREDGKLKSLHALKNEIIARAIEITGHNMTKTARSLGVSKSMIYIRMAQKSARF